MSAFGLSLLNKVELMEFSKGVMWEGFVLASHMLSLINEGNVGEGEYSWL